MGLAGVGEEKRSREELKFLEIAIKCIVSEFRLAKKQKPKKVL